MECVGLRQDRDMVSLAGKGTLSRPRRKWDDIIEINNQEVECGRMDCIGLGQDRVIGKVGGKRPLRKPGVNGMILLKLIFRK